MHLDVPIKVESLFRDPLSLVNTACMTRPQVVDGGEGHQIWRVAANVLNKQSQRVVLRLGSWAGDNNFSPQRKQQVNTVMNFLVP
jgi:hypothetical protein